jgi:glyoxylase-like metal-dependent hydrolase (beta-lactamase superfamily II)
MMGVEGIEEYKVSGSKVYLIDRSLSGSRMVLASYLVVAPSGEALLIDPGPSREYERLLEAVEELLGSLSRLKAVLLTHIHLDHGGSAGHLVETLGDIRVYVHPRGAPHLADPSKLWESSLEILGETALLYGQPKPIPPERLVTPGDGKPIRLGSEAVTVIYTPGHASHHMSYMLGDLIFTGDSAGTLQCSTLFPTTPFPFKLVDAISSLDKMRGLKPRRLAYAHFGIHEPASELLSLYRQLLIDLAEIVWRAMQEGVDMDEIPSYVDRASGIVSRYKECMRSLGAGYVENHILQSIEGIARFLQRFGPQHRGVRA